MLQIKNGAIEAFLIQTDNKLRCQWPRGTANRESEAVCMNEAWTGDKKKGRRRRQISDRQ